MHLTTASNGCHYTSACLSPSIFAGGQTAHTGIVPRHFAVAVLQTIPVVWTSHLHRRVAKCCTHHFRSSRDLCMRLTKRTPEWLSRRQLRGRSKNELRSASFQSQQGREVRPPPYHRFSLRQHRFVALLPISGTHPSLHKCCVFERGAVAFQNTALKLPHRLKVHSIRVSVRRTCGGARRIPRNGALFRDNCPA